MSVIKVNNITNRDGTSGPVIAGITTVSSTSHMVVPTGDTLRRSVKENVVSTGLICYLDFANDESYVGTGVTVVDLSGSGGGPTGIATERNDGRIYNGTFSSQFGGILSLSGIGTVGVGINTTGKKEILQLTNNITISIWYRTSSGIGATGAHLFYSREDLNGTNYGGTMIGYDNVVPGVWKLTKFGVSDVRVGTVPNDSNWHNTTAVFDSINGTFIYIDGSLSGRDSTATSNFAANTSSGVIKLGVSQYGTLYGDIAHLSIYNRPLSQSEITQNYNALKGRFGL